jgi:hypothetical protein
MHHLIVTQDFATYRKGDRIEETAEIDRLLGSELSAHVIRVHAPPKEDAVVDVKTVAVLPPVSPLKEDKAGAADR